MCSVGNRALPPVTPIICPVDPTHWPLCHALLPHTIPCWPHTLPCWPHPLPCYLILCLTHPLPCWPHPVSCWPHPLPCRPHSRPCLPHGREHSDVTTSSWGGRSPYIAGRQVFISVLSLLFVSTLPFFNKVIRFYSITLWSLFFLVCYVNNTTDRMLCWWTQSNAEEHPGWEPASWYYRSPGVKGQGWVIAECAFVLAVW